MGKVTEIYYDRQDQGWAFAERTDDGSGLSGGIEDSDAIRAIDDLLAHGACESGDMDALRFEVGQGRLRIFHRDDESLAPVEMAEEEE